MGFASRIEWTHHTYNPWWGCTRVSPGCDNCYAATLDKRLGGHHWGKDAPRRVFAEKHWAAPLRWHARLKPGQRERVFTASMADVFDAEAPPGALERLWDVIRATPRLDWLLLTKRPTRIARALPPDWGAGWANVWLGTTVENQEQAALRVPVLLRVPARMRFLSCEPLLGPLHLEPWLNPEKFCERCDHRSYGCDDCPWHKAVVLGADFDERTGHQPARRVDWVIAGGESGHGARPMHPAWARMLRDQCVKARVPFFFKQWGEYAPWGRFLGEESGKWDTYVNPDGTGGQCAISPMDEETWTNHAGAAPQPGWALMHRAGKAVAGRELDGRSWDEVPGDPQPRPAASDGASTLTSEVRTHVG